MGNLNILISAYACETGRGGEGEIGWRIVLQLAEKNDVWVITRANLRPVHEVTFRQAPKPERLQFVYFDLPWIFRFYKKGARFFLLYYYLWQIGVALRARRLAREVRFDVLHHLIGGMDWMPSGLALVPGKFIWGPVGSENTHPCMRTHLSLASQIKDRLRVAARWWMRNLDPFVRLTGARASVVLSHTAETMPRRYGHKMQAFAQTAIENSRTLARPKCTYERGVSLRLVFAGELKDWKGARLAVDAALIFFETEPMATLRVIGDGPLRHEMEAAARAHPEGGRVAFLGRLPMDALTDELYASDVFLYPSFHHGLATIVLQAMLTGLPIVCIEGDATARTVGARAGITVSLSEDIEPADEVAKAISWMLKNEAARQRYARNARKIAVTEYGYAEFSKRIDDVYSSIVFPVKS